MVTMRDILGQFRRLGVKPSLLARGEINELPNILVPREEIMHVVMGWYAGGLALLCATNHRVLLIDKKPFFLTIEDLRYDMIAEVKYQYRLLEAVVDLAYLGRTLEFKSWNKPQLRALVCHVQQVIIQLKNIQHGPTEELEAPAETKETGHAPLPPSVAMPPPATAPTAPQFLVAPTFPMERYKAAAAGHGRPHNPYRPAGQSPHGHDARHRIARFITRSQLSR